MVKKALLIAFFFLLMQALLQPHNAGCRIAKGAPAHDSTRTQVRHFDKQQIREFKHSRQFNYDEAPIYGDNILQLALRKILEQLTDFMGNKTNRDILLYSILGILVVFVVLQLLKIHPVALFMRNKPVNQFAYSRAEEGKDLEAIEQARQQALTEQNYRMALRHAFILALLNLEIQGFLQFEPQKTIPEYLNELKNSPKKQLLQELAAHFEYVWYGNFPISEQKYQQIEEQLFKRLVRQ